MSGKPAAAKRPRDMRLDFYRGIAMFIILIAHIPWDPWALWIPARFGFSDATEIFVFCSGMASALAFGVIFKTQSWFLGAARILYRMWQIYWVHIGVFLAVLAVVTTADMWIEGGRYVGKLNLIIFAKDPTTNLLGLVTLTYVPNYFDMLPMYVGILGMLPIVAYLGNIRPLYAGAFVFLVWLAGTTGMLNFPAEPWSDRKWFFNPFAWQLIFFTGFAFASGWLKPPKFDKRYVAIAVAIVLITVPFAWYMTLRAYPELKAINTELKPLITKSDFGALRYIHFLAVAYLAFWAVGEGGRRLLEATGLWRRIIDVIRLVGQQSLAVFASSLVIAQSLGVVLDLLGRSTLVVAAVNLFGFACLIGVAAFMRWFKSEPWRPRPAKAAARQDAAGPAMPRPATAAPER